MASLEELRAERLRKLTLLRERGLEPYPVETRRDCNLAEAIANFATLVKRSKPLNLAGRVRAVRGQGAIIFFDFDDGTGRLQGLLKKGETPPEMMALFAEIADVGDFIGVSGSLFLTQRKEKTVLVKNWTMLGKSLRPLPDKWHGLADVEERFRRRYLDLLMSPAVKERFVLRSRLISGIRNFLDKAGYQEVETPILQPLAGGTNAEPFVTHHQALNVDLYLRIAEELYLKRLLIGGLPKVYSLAKNFRNEGVDQIHNPEFTMLEFYESFATAADQMVFVEKLFKTITKLVTGGSKIKYQGKELDFGKRFAVVTFFDLLRRHALIINPETISRRDLEVKAGQLGVTVTEREPVEKIMDNIYKKICRPKLEKPTFVVDFPKDYLPLAKRHPDRPELVDAWLLVVGGLELVKAFSELNDPLDQRERFLEQEKRRLGGDVEAQPLDEDFLEALEYGMPPAGGVGIGIDRLAMLFTDSKNIKEVIYFPTLKTKS